MKKVEDFIAHQNRDLHDIGLRAGTDKVTHHHYDNYYSRFLSCFRDISGAAMLEIGIQEGKSLGMWLDYFKNAFVYGIDITVSSTGPRHKIFKADQSDLATVRALLKSEIDHPLFLIVDDGSHLPEHQAASFEMLFHEWLQPGGVYIIEDIEVSYWTKLGLYGYQTNYGYRHPLSIIELFREVLDDLNSEFLTPANRKIQDLKINGRLSPQTRSAISSITFAKNCIIIAKKTEQELAANENAYRFAKWL